jgi:hypothetical protein
VGAALGLIVAEGKTEASVRGSITADGDVTIATATEKDLSVVADASATNSTTGVGVAIGIVVANSNNKLFVADDITIDAGSLTLSSGMAFEEETEETDEEEPEEAAEEGEEAPCENNCGE